jgi:hypothetical protein
VTGLNPAVIGVGGDRDPTDRRMFAADTPVMIRIRSSVQLWRSLNTVTRVFVTFVENDLRRKRCGS